MFTGDVGHGRHLQEVFDFIHRLARQAHRLGGRIVWTLGNHDLYVDREGGQGGEDSLGYRLWPKIREAALHPERHPGLVVQAAYFDHGKLFVHAGILPNIVDIAMREQGARGAEDDRVLRERGVSPRARRKREDQGSRPAARDLPHRYEPYEGATSAGRDRVRARRHFHARPSRGGPLPVPRQAPAAGHRPYRKQERRDPVLPGLVAPTRLHRDRRRAAARDRQRRPPPDRFRLGGGHARRTRAARRNKAAVREARSRGGSG